NEQQRYREHQDSGKHDGWMYQKQLSICENFVTDGKSLWRQMQSVLGWRLLLFDRLISLRKKFSTGGLDEGIFRSGNALCNDCPCAAGDDGGPGSKRQCQLHRRERDSARDKGHSDTRGPEPRGKEVYVAPGI